MTDQEIIQRLLKSDLSNVENVSNLFDMARHMDGKGLSSISIPLALKARAHANVLASRNPAAYDLLKRIYLWLAPKDFDSYLTYLEWNRKPEERFYLPRRSIIKPFVDALQELADDKLDELFLSVPPRCGKLLADSTPVLTTKGWKKHGDLAVGDYVFNPDGKAVRVIAVHPKYHTTHTVTMTDGSTFKCHFRHEWKVYDRSKRKEVTIETQEMLRTGIEYGKPGHRGHRYRYQIEPTKPIAPEKAQNLKVKPYSMGAWLGDGSTYSPNITYDLKDYAVIDRIKRDGYTVRRTQRCVNGVQAYTDTFDGLGDGLREYDLCRSKRKSIKHIPEDYFLASIQERLELLAGLLDTDGYLHKSQNRYYFSTSNEQLRDDFVKLVSTFGWRATVTEYTKEQQSSGSGFGASCSNYCIGFNPTIFIPCQLERKQLNVVSKQRKLGIASIVESEPERGNCITVEGGMYLAGERLIPTHNTSLLMFYMTWTIGRDSEKANLYCAYSDVITSAFYNGVLEVINDPTTYLWHEIFPGSQIASTNSKDETLNIDRKKRYASLTCRSLYGTLNGSVDVNGILMSDDLISGIEEAMSKDRLISAWSKVDNNMLTRAKSGCKLLWCGTRWSLTDPIGLRIDTVLNNPKFANRRVKIINIPALNEKDESNFNYDYGVGFDTEYYHQRRASFERNNDIASWNAQYMQEPIERDGAVFSPNDFRYFNGVLPDGEPDRIFASLDPSWGGGDYCAMPVIAKYGGDLYVIDVVYDNGDKRTTQPLIADAVIRYNVGALQIEATKMTEDYAEGVDSILKEKGKRINLTTRVAQRTVGGKEQRIFDKAPDIREKMIFLEDGKRSKAYQLFMQNVFSFKIVGKNKNDDAPDSLCMAVTMDEETGYRPRIIPRLW